MGFTRSTTDTEVHQNMPDYPSAEGYTTSQLKEAFDAPATGLKTDLNGLMNELEDAFSASKLGADEIAEDDTSDANVQAKLEKIYEDMQGLALGDIPDNTITKAKLVSTYSATLAEKDGTLQTGLNSEQLGGKNLAYILGEITAASQSIGTFTTSNQGALDNWQITINVGFNHKPSLGVVIGTKHLYLERASSSDSTLYAHEGTATVTNNSVTITGFGSGINYSYIAFR